MVAAVEVVDMVVEVAVGGVEQRAVTPCSGGSLEVLCVLSH